MASSTRRIAPERSSYLLPLPRTTSGSLDAHAVGETIEQPTLDVVGGALAARRSDPLVSAAASSLRCHVSWCVDLG